MSAATTPPPQPTLARELAIEQAYVDRVYASLKGAIEAARHIETESRVRFTSDRADWVREEDGTALFERDAFAFQAAKRLAVLGAEHEGLVFGRLDMADQETRYVGRIGVRDSEYEPLVIDWRAPAAEPFYRATASNSMDVIRRRVLYCRDDRVVDIEDDLLDSANNATLTLIGEGALMAALSRARTHQMRDIVATIQAEQDLAIRAPYQGVTVITGGPGTGKTVVALHRAAYLLYTHRRRFENGGVLIVGPSQVFMSYIERVLPGLGEDSVTLRSIGHVAEDVLGFGADRSDTAAGATVKGKLAMRELLRRLIEVPLISATEAELLQVSIQGEVLTLRAAELSKIRSAILASRRSNQARDAVARALLDALWEQVPPELIGPELTRASFDENVTSQARWTMFLQAWWPILDPEQVLARLGDVELTRQLAAGLLSDAQVVALAESYSSALGFVPNAGRERPAWTISDIALLDELAALLGPAPADPANEPEVFIELPGDMSELVTTTDLLDAAEVDEEDAGVEPRNFAHVLVDESQDVTPMQWRMLRRRGPQASWTLVGDSAQSSYPYPDETERAVAELVRHTTVQTFHLSKNYRSPAEVFELAANYIKAFCPDADIPAAVRETGHQPSLITTTPEQLNATLDAELAELSTQVEGTIGVIAPPSVEHQLRQEWESPGRLGDRVSLLGALQAKGLEFDAAIVVAPDLIVAEAPAGERVLYVDLTRATQRLVVIDLTAPQPGAWQESLGSHQNGSE